MARHAVASSSNARSSIETKKKLNEKVTYWAVVRKVVMNLVSTLLIIKSVIVLALILTTDGYFSGLTGNRRPQSVGEAWRHWSYNKIDKDGWKDGLKNKEFVFGNELVWKRMGKKMAEDHSLKDSDILFATVCIVAGTEDSGWVSLAVVLDNKAQPNCVLDGKPDEEISGMTFIETAATNDHPNGLFLFVNYVETPDSKKVERETIDKDIPHGMSTIIKSLVTFEGEVLDAEWETKNWEVISRSLGDWARLSAFCVVDAAVIKESDIKGETGRSIGKFSKEPVTIGWLCGHGVENQPLIVFLQVMCLISTMIILMSDFLTTYFGLKGLIHRKPVLTYDIFSGLERRKALLVILIGTDWISLLYGDVARYKLQAEVSGRLIVLANLSVGSFIGYFFLAIIVCVQYVPQIEVFKGKALAFSTTALVYGTVVIFPIVYELLDVKTKAYNGFWGKSVSRMGIVVDGTEYAAGAYDPAGTPDVSSYCWEAYVATILGSFCLSIIHCRITGGYFICDLNWISENSFLQHIRRPNWITGIPLDLKNTIKFGNKSYCRPSTLAYLGYVAVEDLTRRSSTANSSTSVSSKYAVEVSNSSQMVHQSSNTSDKYSSSSLKTTQFMISIYYIIPCLATLPLNIPVLGSIQENQFSKPMGKPMLSRNMKYTRAPGICIG